MRTMHMLHSLDVEPSQNGSTVRKGFKWADLIEGELLELCVCTKDPETHDVQGTGYVWELWFGRFEDIPARLLRWEHELRSREYNGLLASMRHAYGRDFSESDPVTVVLYRRIS